MSDSVRPHRQQPTRLPRPWDSPGKNTGVGCHFLLQCMKVKSESEVAQSCPTLSNPMDYRLPGSSIHGIFQAKVLEWVAIAFSVNELKTLHYLETNFRTWLVTLPPPSVDIGAFLGMPSITISVSSNLTILQAASESWSGKVTNTQAKDSKKSSSQYLLSHFYRLWAWACFLYFLSYEI